ncbi:hypothetical protein DYB38_008018 [Aphanomyces astaci]|uniref:Uncharacterized protein n=1 Tax=Aphanomyces astaci TaxID=112090 RepID=A0A397DWY7_APHAT|nr:hypothetical protein DYB38_008018 [Aphanomyces astaci]
MEATNEERPELRPTDPGGATSSSDLLHRRMDALERQMDSLPDRICLAISRQAMAREAVVDETLYLIRQRLEGIETRVDRLSFGVSRVLDGKPVAAAGGVESAAGKGTPGPPDTSSTELTLAMRTLTTALLHTRNGLNLPSSPSGGPSSTLARERDVPLKTLDVAKRSRADPPQALVPILPSSVLSSQSKQQPPQSTRFITSGDIPRPNSHGANPLHYDRFRDHRDGPTTSFLHHIVVPMGATSPSSPRAASITAFNSSDHQAHRSVSSPRRAPRQAMLNHPASVDVPRNSAVSLHVADPKTSTDQQKPPAPEKPATSHPPFSEVQKTLDIHISEEDYLELIASPPRPDPTTPRAMSSPSTTIPAASRTTSYDNPVVKKKRGPKKGWKQEKAARLLLLEGRTNESTARETPSDVARTEPDDNGLAVSPASKHHAQSWRSHLDDVPRPQNADSNASPRGEVPIKRRGRPKKIGGPSDLASRKNPPGRPKGWTAAGPEDTSMPLVGGRRGGAGRPKRTSLGRTSPVLIDTGGVETSNVTTDQPASDDDGCSLSKRQKTADKEVNNEAALVPPPPKAPTILDTPSDLFEDIFGAHNSSSDIPSPLVKPIKAEEGQTQSQSLDDVVPRQVGRPKKKRGRPRKVDEEPYKGPSSTTTPPDGMATRSVTTRHQLPDADPTVSTSITVAQQAAAGHEDMDLSDASEMEWLPTSPGRRRYLPVENGTTLEGATAGGALEPSASSHGRPPSSGLTTANTSAISSPVKTGPTGPFPSSSMHRFPPPPTRAEFEALRLQAGFRLAHLRQPHAAVGPGGLALSPPLPPSPSTKHNAAAPGAPQVYPPHPTLVERPPLDTPNQHKPPRWAAVPYLTAPPPPNQHGGTSASPAFAHGSVDHLTSEQHAQRASTELQHTSVAPKDSSTDDLPPDTSVHTNVEDSTKTSRFCSDTGLFEWTDGQKRRAPENWRCPASTCKTMWCYWFRGDAVNQIGPFRFLTSVDVRDVNSRTLLDRGRAVMDHLIRIAIASQLAVSLEHISEMAPSEFMAVFDLSFDKFLGKTGADGTLTRDGFEKLRADQVMYDMYGSVYEIMAREQKRKTG